MGFSILHLNKWISSRVACTCLKAENLHQIHECFAFFQWDSVPLTFVFPGN